MRRNLSVTVQPYGRDVSVSPGTTVLDAARLAGVSIESPCGGQGLCGKCLVHAEPRSAVVVGRSRARISGQSRRAGLVLACRSRVRANVVIRVSGHQQYKISQPFRSRRLPAPRSANIRKQIVEITPRATTDLRSDLGRIISQLGHVHAGALSLRALRNLPSCLSGGRGGRITVATDNGHILAIEAGDTTSALCGVAFDIGTTTVVGRLLDLRHGGDLAAAARANPQARYGDDVVSRIAHASKGRKSLEQLHGAIVGCMNDILGELCRVAKVAPRAIYGATIAGNTAMVHLFLGVDPTSLGQAPYTPVAGGPLEFRAGELGLNILPDAIVRTLPCVAGFLGGDAVGVVLASGIHHAEDRKLAIDIGTNGEIMLGGKGKLLACSAAAGPAFEGARIHDGMRAAPGAIDSVTIEDDLKLTTIGHKKPLGICGSGLIDAIAELLRARIIEPGGRLLGRTEVPPGATRKLVKRLRRSKGTSYVLLVAPEESGNGRPIVLTQRDVREAQLAKAAIASAIEILLKEAQIGPGDLSQVLLAGAFGNFIRPHQAMGLGLLPPVSLDRVKFIGNAACDGAKLVLLSKRLRRESTRIAERMAYVELAARIDFQETFARNIPFPSNDG